MASIRDVAKLADVGVGTVSRALNGTGYVSAETKKKIDEAIKSLDYTPNELARNLFRKRTGIIGVMVPDLEHPFFSSFVKHVEMALYREGYKTMICNTVEISSRENDYLNMLERNIVDGIITGAHSLKDETYLKIDKPIVAMDRDFGSKVPLIHSDHVKGGRLAAERLIQGGCRKVVQIKGYAAVKTPSNDRHVEFDRVMRENGVEVISREAGWNKLSYGELEAVAAQVMEQERDVDGIFAADIASLFCLNIARQRGIRVPEDLKIIGYDAMEMTRLTYPVLTAVAQDVEQLANACVSKVLERIEGRNETENHQVFDVKLQEGGTA